MANICKASTENDKHEISVIPPQLPTLIPSALRTSHNFYFTGTYPINDTYDAYYQVTSGRVNDRIMFCILSVNLNNPFRPIHGAFVPASTNNTYTGWQTNLAAIFSRFTSPYTAQGLNLYKDLFKYYKVESSEWYIEFWDEAGLDGETVTAPYSIHTFHQNNEPDNIIPLPMRLSSGNISSESATAANMMNPRIGTICGGELLGPPGTVGYTGLTNETVQWNFAPMLKTAFKYNSTSSVASDPANTSNVQMWTPTTSGGLTPPIINRMWFFGKPAINHLFGAAGDVKFRPRVRVRAKFHICWRDHAANDAMFTNTTDYPTT